MLFLAKKINCKNKSEMQKTKANGKEVEANTLYSNYKKIPEWVVYPFSIGGDMGDIEVSKVEINSKIDDAVFKPGK